MTNFILGVFEITIGMSLFIALLLLGLKVFGGKFTAKCRYIIWALVILRLAIPFSFGLLPTLIEIPIETELVQNENDSSATLENTDPITPSQPSDSSDIAVTPTVPSVPNAAHTNPGNKPTLPTDQAEPVIPSEPIIETPTEHPILLKQILDITGAVYLIGGAVFLIWSLVSYVIYTRKILCSAKAVDNRIQQIFYSVCKKYGIKKQPALLVASGIISPAAFGIFRRRIVLPDIEFTENGLVCTLAHEITHCKRGDLYVKLVELIARSLNWFNPLVHIAAFKCEMEMELSCDECVLSGSNEAARAAYADVMLDIIRRCRRNRGALTTHFNPKKSAVTARFKNILYGSGKRRGRILIGVCLVLCILAGTFVACQTGDDLTDDESSSSLNQTNGVKDIENTSNYEIKRYMNCFVRYFHEPFSIGEIQYPDTILGLVFEYCFYNHDKLNDVKIDEMSFDMSINSADFQEIASYLLGDDFEVTKDPRWILLSGRYDEAVDRYVTSSAKDYWGGDSFSIEFGSELTIKECSGKVYVTANVGVWDEVYGNYVPPRTLEYIFNIVDGNGLIYYQIEQITLIE